MLHMQLKIIAVLFGGNCCMGIVIEDHTVLQYFYQRSTNMFGSMHKNLRHQFRVGIDGTGIESSLCPDHQFCSLERSFN